MEQEAGWAPEPFGKKLNLFSLPKNLITIPSCPALARPSPLASHITDYAIPDLKIVRNR